jgi:hypothetical protein
MIATFVKTSAANGMIAAFVKTSAANGMIATFVRTSAANGMIATFVRTSTFNGTIVWFGNRELRTEKYRYFRKSKYKACEINSSFHWHSSLSLDLVQKTRTTLET